MSAPELVHTVSTGSTSSDESRVNDLPTGVVESGFKTDKTLGSADEIELGRPDLISEGIGLGENVPAFQISSAAALVGEIPEIPAISQETGFEFLPRGPPKNQTAIKKESDEEKKKREEKERKEREKRKKEEEKKRKKN